jgi:hypothetical protein
MSVRRVIVTWLSLIASSFVIGGALIVTVPSLPTVSIGVWTNVVMAVSVGAVLGWTKRWRQLPTFVLAGAVVTILGVDGLVLTPPGGSVFLGGVIAFDVIAVIMATIGMSLLLGLGAIVGAIGRVLDSRCHCQVRLRGRLEVSG